SFDGLHRPPPAQRRYLGNIVLEPSHEDFGAKVPSGRFIIAKARVADIVAISILIACSDARRPAAQDIFACHWNLICQLTAALFPIALGPSEMRPSLGRFVRLASPQGGRTHPRRPDDRSNGNKNRDFHLMMEDNSPPPLLSAR